MPAKTIDQNPSITDTVLIDIITPDPDGCFSANPYVVSQLTIYYVERNFVGGPTKRYDAKQYDDTQLAEAQKAKALACSSPTEENIEAAKLAASLADSNSSLVPVYYNEAVAVQVVGDSDFPAWLSTDTENAPLELVEEDEDGNTQYGHFRYSWNPLGMREGDYFACWTWTMQPAGTQQAAHTPFTLKGDTAQTTSIPTHQTAQGKYATLLERYLPEMFKMFLTSTDLTPTVLENLNNSIALGFTDLENMGNQIVDLTDSNATAEAYLPLLARMLGLTLKSDDPTRWRRQIKRAVPLYKMKGTVNGLKEAFAQAGMTMTKFTRMWQVVSPYTWQEELVYVGGNEFTLSKTAVGSVDEDNYGVWIRHADDTSFAAADLGDLSFSTLGGETTATWTGDALEDGDSLLVLYLVAEVPDNTAQLLENYVRTLPLADQRDERSQDFPPKNWNVRVIEEDDPMFGVVIKDRFPYIDPLVFGQVRTEFAYSENVYGMEEYDGSLRNSPDPCNIDKAFLDPCGQCQGSKYMIDLEIQDLSNDRLLEAQEILKEFVPFHAVLHSINFTGGVSEFMQPPVEDVQCIIRRTGQEEVIAGGAQDVFGRAMFGGASFAQVKRNVLATSTTETTEGGTAYNGRIVLYCPDIKFDQLGMGTDNVVEVLSPSPLEGVYVLSDPANNTAGIAPNPTAIAEPINRSPFTFRLSNDVYVTTSAAINRDNFVLLTDEAVDFAELAVDDTWSVDIPAYGGPFQVKNILPDGSLVLEDDGSLPTSDTGSVTYSLLDGSSVERASGTGGELDVTRRGRVDLDTDTTLTDVRRLTAAGQYLLDQTGDQYRVTGFVSGEAKQFYIADWAGGDVAGRTIHIYDRLADGQIGYLDYQGQYLQAAGDLEDSLGINNGTNPPADVMEDDRFKENFLVVIGSDYYSISEIDAGLLSIVGPAYDWGTLSSGGTGVTFSVLRFTKEAATIQGQEFDFVDRRGKEIINKTVETASSFAPAMATAMNDPSAAADTTVQDENIGFHIEYADGSKERGNI